MKSIILVITVGIFLTTCVGEVLKAECDFGAPSSVNEGGETTGVIKFDQATEIGGSSIDLSNVKTTKGEGWHIHTYGISEKSCGADIAGGHYNPGCTDSPCEAPNCKCLGEMSNKWGKLNALATKNINDPQIVLSGPNSVAGRSIVVHAADGSRIACCTIRITSGLFGEAVVYQPTAATSVCTIDTRAIITVTQLDANSPGIRKGSSIAVSVTDATMAQAMEAGIHIHQNALPVGSNDCSTAGGHYNPDDGLNFVNQDGKSMALGELSYKHGGITGAGTYTATYQDAAVNLKGSFSVAEKSVVVHDPTDSSNRLGCCNFQTGAAPDTNFEVVKQSAQKASCDFVTSEATGTIFFETEANGEMGTRIWSSGIQFYEPTESAASHNYHIHSFGDEASKCSNAGPHYGATYDMGYFGPDANGLPWYTGGVMEIGDLSGKHGKLNDSTSFDYYDGSVALEGSFSVMGRSVTIHDSKGDKFVCCVIRAVNPVAPVVTTSEQMTTTSKTADKVDDTENSGFSLSCFGFFSLVVVFLFLKN